MGTIDNPLSRIQALQAKLNQEAKCPRCGSSWFTEMTFHKYSSTAYGSAELATQEYMPQAIRVCLCGWLCKPSPQVRTGRTPNIESQSFRDSIDLAIAKITNEGKFAELKETLRLIVEQMITRYEVQRIDARIGGQQEEIDKLKACLGRGKGPKSEPGKQSEKGPESGKELQENAAAPNLQTDGKKPQVRDKRGLR
jgi:hypothetical protein